MKWTPDELDYLVAAGAKCSTLEDWGEVARHLDRTAHACRIKYGTLPAGAPPPEGVAPCETPEPVKEESGAPERFSFVYISDTHGDLVDLDCVSAIKDFVDAYKPEQRYHGGDVFDLRPLRNGAGAEDRGQSIIDDVDAGLDLLNWFRPHRITWGNHDVRLWDMAGSLRESFEIDAARMLKQRIETHAAVAGAVTAPYEKRTGWQEIAPGRLIGHGYVSSMYPAKVNCVHWGSTITGHVHALDYHRVDNMRGDESYVSGCLCEIDQSYNRAHRRTLKHEHAFLYGIADQASGDWQIWPVRKDSRGKWMTPFPLQ